MRGSAADEPMTERLADARRFGPDNLAGAPGLGGRSALGRWTGRLGTILECRQC